MFKYNLVTSSATKKNSFSQKVIDCCTSIDKINDRIIKIDFEVNPSVSVICSYSLTNILPGQEIQSFYNTLINTVNDIPANNILFIALDFNAKIGPLDA